MKPLFLVSLMLWAMVSWPAAAGGGKRPGAAAVAPPGRDAPLFNPEEAAETAKAIPILKTGPGIFKIGALLVNKLEGTVSVKGRVNMNEGLVEYLACGPRGKLHESVLVLDVEPYNLQIALLLIGLEPGNKPISAQGASELPKGDPVELWVSWQDDKKQTVRQRAEALIFNRVVGRPMRRTHWVFSGSQIMDGRFMAQMEQSIAATYHDPFAILDHPLPTGDDDTLYFANTRVLPPVKTPVTFVIRALNRDDLKPHPKKE